MITTKHVPFHVCGAQQDNSTLCIPSNNGMPGRGGGGTGGTGRDTEPFYPVGGGEPGYIAPDPKDVDVFFAGTNNGRFLTRLNRRTGELREVGPYPRFFSGETSSVGRRALAVDLSRSSSRRSIRTSSTPRRSTCGRRPTAARPGTRSAAT